MFSFITYLLKTILLCAGALHGKCSLQSHGLIHTCVVSNKRTWTPDLLYSSATTQSNVRTSGSLRFSHIFQKALLKCTESRVLLASNFIHVTHCRICQPVRSAYDLWQFFFFFSYQIFISFTSLLSLVFPIRPCKSLASVIPTPK